MGGEHRREGYRCYEEKGDFRTRVPRTEEILVRENLGSGVIKINWKNIMKRYANRSKGLELAKTTVPFFCHSVQ